MDEMLRKQVVAALRPFADGANGFEWLGRADPDEFPVVGIVWPGGKRDLTVGDLRRARVVLEALETEEFLTG